MAASETNRVLPAEHDEGDHLLTSDQTSQLFLRNALDSLPQNVAILDRHGTIVEVNEGWRSFADENGFDQPNYGLGMNYIEICEQIAGRNAFDARRVADAIRRALTGEDIDFALEYECNCGDEERWFTVSVTRFASPDTPHVIVSHEDVTRRIVAERDLFELARTMETLMASSPAAIVGVDVDTRVTHWNPAAERIFGWTKDEVLGQINPIFHESERQQMLEYHQQLLNGEIVVGREVRRLTSDGRMVPVHVSVAPIASMDGQPRGALGIFLDLAARVEVEDELRRREQQYRALVENMPDLVVRCDRDLRVVYGNPPATTLIPDIVDGDIGPLISELGLPATEVEFWTRHLRHILDTGEPLNIELDAPGSGATFDVRLVPEFSPDGTPESVLIVGRDITEHKRREVERQFLSDAWSRLASTLDFETTLATIMELMVPQFADICSISLFDDGGVPIRRVATVEAVDGEKVVPHVNLLKYELEPVGEFGISRVYKTGQPSVYPIIDSETVAAKISPAPLREAVRSIDMRSAMFVPLKVRGEVIGALACVYNRSGRRYSESDLPFAEDLAIRAAIAIDNARLHQDLERSEERYRTLVEQIPAVVYTTSVTDLNQPLYLSPQIQQLTGYTAEELIEQRPSWYDIVHPEDRSLVASSDESAIETGSARSIDYRLITRDGRTIWIREDARLIWDEDGEPRNWQGILNDVTLQKELESQLTHQAFHDTLTGLPNRALFDDRVRHAQERRTRFGASIAVCFMDLDNFKVINDSLGHTVGDELLIQVARRIQRCLRADDTAARFGGDEFALLLEGISSTASAVRVVSRIVVAFDEPFKVGCRELYVTPSIGISIATPEDAANRDLMREADAAMYQAKRSGKARFELYTPTLTVDAVNRLDLENDLRKTLNGEQMAIHYQPVIDLATGEVRGVEALVRWQHPEHGPIPPGRFIPIAEETSMIVELGRWILEESCSRVHAWNLSRNSDQQLRLSVNLSARQFSDPSLVDDIRKILDDVGFDPALLCLEITESVMTDDQQAAARMMARLKALGVCLAVDDFGTGYSSLSSLRRFPVDRLKIDRSFVDGLVNDPNDSVIVSGVIGMAHALNLDVIAEGVETVEQRDQLIDLRCDLAQGYLFSKPLEPEAFEGRYLQPPATVPPRM